MWPESSQQQLADGDQAKTETLRWHNPQQVTERKRDSAGFERKNKRKKEEIREIVVTVRYTKDELVEQMRVMENKILSEDREEKI